MSLHRKRRRYLLRREGAALRRIPTPIGRLYALMVRLGCKRLFTAMMRRPCHVADLYIGNEFYDERYLIPNGEQQNVRQMRAELRERIQRRSMHAMANSNRFINLLNGK